MAKRTIKVDQEEAQRLLSLLDNVKHGAINASVRAAQETLIRTKPIIQARMAKQARIPEKALDGRIFLRFPKGGRPMATIWLGVRPIPVVKIGDPVLTPEGVRVGERLFPRAFTATMKSGHFGVFKRREDENSPGNLVDRLKIDEQRIVLKPRIPRKDIRTIHLEVLAREVNKELQEAARAQLRLQNRITRWARK